MKDQKYNNLETDVIDAKESDYLFIKTSQIPFTESGLYTALAIYKNEIIAIFKGESITNIEAAKRAKRNQNHYFVCLPDGGMLDSMHVKCFAKYANDAEGFTKSKFKNNAIITLDDNDNPCLVAKRDIKKGEEVFCAYGKEYWKSFRKEIKNT